MAYCALYGHFHHDFAKLDDTKYCSYRNNAQIDIKVPFYRFSLFCHVFLKHT